MLSTSDHSRVETNEVYMRELVFILDFYILNIIHHYLRLQSAIANLTR
jgi:hypothetical protein